MEMATYQHLFGKGFLAKMTRPTAIIILWSTFLFPAMGELVAAEILPPDRQIAEVIDHYVDLKMMEAGIVPAPQAEEATLVRRLTLDLVGRIPLVTEVKSYLDSSYPSKRLHLIDRLMSSPAYIHHSATEFNTFLRADNSAAPNLRNYLMVALREQRSWDRMFQDMLGVSDGERHLAHHFVSKRLTNRDALTRDVSRVFFGINVSCCQCHDHPYVDSLTQDNFFGLKAFFHRSYDFHDRLMERQFSKPLAFSTHDGDERAASLVFLTGATLEESAPDVADLKKAIEEEDTLIAKLREAFEEKKEFPTDASSSGRARLVELALRPAQRHLLARTIINQLWYRFFGHGLVMRTDQMHSSNPPSHPELLEWLVRDFIEHGYDLRRVVRGLVASHTYSRSSRWMQGESPASELFAVADVRPLTPMQYGMSLRVASVPDYLPPEATSSELNAQLGRLESEAKKYFSGFIVQPYEDLQIGVDEALRLSNQPEVLKVLGEGLVPRLFSVTDRNEQIEMAVWTVLSRPPAEDEFQVLGEFLSGHEPKDVERAKVLSLSIEKLVAIERAKQRVVSLNGEIETRRTSFRDQAVQSEISRTVDYLGAATEFEFVDRSQFATTINSLADQHGLTRDVLRHWVEYLGLAKTKMVVRHFSEKISNVMGQAHLKGWGTIKGAHVIANTSPHPFNLNFGEGYRSNLLQPRSLNVRPTLTKRVAIGWVSPIAGKIDLSGRIADVDRSSGNGVAWTIERRRGNEAQVLSSGVLENGEQTSLDTNDVFEVERGDLLSVIIDAHEGDDRYDTTEIDWVINEIGGQARSWKLMPDVVDTIQMNNPHPDGFGNLLVWHWYTISEAESEIPAGSLLAHWSKVHSQSRQVAAASSVDDSRGELHKIAGDIQQLLAGAPPENKQDPNAVLHSVLTSPESPLFEGIDFDLQMDAETKAELDQHKDERNKELEISLQTISGEDQADVDRFRSGIQHMVWSLLTGGEFRFNH